MIVTKQFNFYFLHGLSVIIIVLFGVFAVPSIEAESGKDVTANPPEKWTGAFWLGGQNSPLPKAFFRKTFNVPEKPGKCFISITPVDLGNLKGTGKCTLMINGKIAETYKIGSLQDMDMYSRGSPIASYIEPGLNTIGLAIALDDNKGNVGFNLEVEVLKDGIGKTILRSDSSWKYYPGLADGSNWSKNDFDDSSWICAKELGRKWGMPRTFWGANNKVKTPIHKLIATVDEQFEKLVELQLEQEDLNIVPRPHYMKLAARENFLPENIAGKYSGGENADFAVSRLEKALKIMGFKGDGIKKDPVLNGRNIIIFGAGLRVEDLEQSLDVSRNEVMALSPEGFAITPVLNGNSVKGFILEGRDGQGLLYASYTFLQLFSKRGAEISVRSMCIVDYPDIKERCLIGDGGFNADLAWLSFYRVNQYLVFSNIADDIDPAFVEFNTFLHRIGMGSTFYIHFPSDFSFGNPEHIKIILDKIESAARAGFDAVYLAADDFPTATSAIDSIRYGPGVPGLAKAHVECLTKAFQKCEENKVSLYFGAMVYDKKAYTDLDAVEYLKIIGGGIPRDVHITNAVRDPDKLKHLPPIFDNWESLDRKKGYTEFLNNCLQRKPVFWSNEFGRGHYIGKMEILYFSEYPQVSLANSNLFEGAWVLCCAFGIDRASTLCFFNNFWNCNAPLDMKSALLKEWGPVPAEFLYRYARLIGLQTQWGPGINIWQEKLTPNVSALEYLREIAKGAEAAKEMNWSGSTLSPEMIGRLTQSAIAIELCFTLFGDWMERKLIQSGTLKASPERLDELAKRIKFTKQELTQMGAGEFELRWFSNCWEYK